MTMTTPATITPEIRTFCDSLVRGSAPVFVEYVPHEGAVANDCFDNVSRLIAERGGSVLLGWTIWEWDSLLLEAEFHAVWQDLDGTLHDPTPKADGESRILFLPDRDAVDDGGVIPSRHQVLNDWQEVADYVEVCRQISDFQRQHYPNLPAIEWNLLLQRKDSLLERIQRRANTEMSRQIGRSELLLGLSVSPEDAQRRSAISRSDVEARTAHARYLASQGDFRQAFDVLLESARESQQIARQLGDTFRLLFTICDEPSLVNGTRREWSQLLY